MKPRFQIPLSCLILLLTIFSLLFMTRSVQAQQTRVADTVTFVLKQHKKPAQQCDALYELGTYYWNIAQPENALVVMNQSKEIAEKHRYDKGVYDAYSIIGAIYLKQNDYEKVRSVYRECLQLANKNHSEYGANKANYLMAVMYMKDGNWDSLIAISRATLDVPHTVYDSVTLPKFNLMLGNGYMAKGDYQNAQRCYLDALAVAEKTNNESIQGVCIGSLANINGELRNYPEAIRYNKKALALAMKNNQMEQTASAQHSLGAHFRDMQIPDSAMYYFKLARLGYTSFGYPEGVALATNNLGATLIDLNQIDSGMVYLQSAKKDFIALRDTFNIANNALLLGAVYRLIGVSKKDRSYFPLAMNELLLCQQIAAQKSLVDLKMKCYYQLAVVQEAQGNESEAFTYLKYYNLISDSIRSQAYTQQIAEMQTKYETEKKETEIAKLNVEKQLDAEKMARQKVVNYSLLSMAALILLSGSLIFRNVQKKRIAEKHVAILEKQNAIESMRSKIASDVHDEMGANLTRLGLNAQQLLQNPGDPEREKQLAEKMAMQSKEILTGMREIIWASNPANDNLKSMLGFMRQYIDRFFDGTQIHSVVNFPHEVGEVTLHPEVRRNLFLILKESLNNALKYSGSDRIDIDFHTENEKYRFEVKDYGKGLDDEKKNDFSSGLRNMQMRAEQIQSLFKLIAAPGQGVQIIVEGKLY